MIRFTQPINLSSERNFAILFLLSLFLLLSVLTSKSQQQPGYTQYMWDQLVINPAYAGTTDSWSARLFYRNQWAGFEGSPENQHLSIQTPLQNDKFGVGLHVNHDKLGISEFVGATASFAYRMKLKKGKLGFGLNADYGVQQMNWSALNPKDEDLELPYGDGRESAPNFGFGVYYHTKQLYIGLAAPKLLETDLNFNETESGVNTDYSLKRHYYLTAGYAIEINPNLVLKPSLMTRYAYHSPVQVDMNVSVLINKVVWIGAGYRLGDSADLMVQYNITSSLKVGYAYDFTLTRIQNHLGSHELFLGWDMQRKKDGYNHPRYF